MIKIERTEGDFARGSDKAANFVWLNRGKQSLVADIKQPDNVAAFSRHPALRRTTVDTPNGQVSLAAPPVPCSDGPGLLGPLPAVGEHSAVIRVEFGG